MRSQSPGYIVLILISIPRLNSFATGRAKGVKFCSVWNVPEILNVHMNEIYKKLTTIK